MGTKATCIFRLKGFRPQRLSLSQQVLAAVMNEQEKKQACNERILQIDHGIFNPPPPPGVFTQRYYGKRVQKFYSRLVQLTSEKRDLPQSVSSNWIRIKVCFGLLK